MKAVIQRVTSASVSVDGSEISKINEGLFILLGVEKGDTENDAFLLAEKISKLRIFSDENDKMNLSVKDIDGEVLVVSNFTLNANYAHGNRPDFLNAASPDEADKLYCHFVTLMKERVKHVGTGKFGAYMQIDMSADGPITIVMDSAKLKKGKAQ